MTAVNVAATLAAAVIAVALCELARRRVAAQPVAYDTEAEARLLEALEQAPEALADVRRAGLDDQAFVVAEHRQRWQELNQRATATRDDAEGGDAGEENEVGEDGACGATFAGGALASVLACAADRATYPGRAAAVESGDRERPLVRHRPRLSPLRMFASAAVGAAFTAVAADGTGGWAFAALAIWAATGIVVALVDIDTLLLDLPVYSVGYGAAWVAALVAAGPAAVAVGAGVAAAVAGLMWAVGVAMSRARGHDGLGFGDVIIVLSSVGVPVAGAGRSGDPWVLHAGAGFSWGMFTLAIGGVLGGVGWAFEARRSGKGLLTPFAFGPGLVGGAMLAWVAL